MLQHMPCPWGTQVYHQGSSELAANDIIMDYARGRDTLETYNITDQYLSVVVSVSYHLIGHHVQNTLKGRETSLVTRIIILYLL